MTDFAVVTYQLQGTTTTTALATFASLDIRTLLQQRFWYSCGYVVSYQMFGLKSDGSKRCLFGRVLLYYSNSAGAWTQEGVTSLHSTLRTDSTYSLAEVASSFGYDQQGRGNTTTSETVNWLVRGTLQAIK